MALNYGGKRGQWKGRGVSTDKTWANLAKPVYICRGCELWNEARFDPIKKKDQPPAVCPQCGRMDFDHFHSKGEAGRYMALKRMQDAGRISELQTQWPIALIVMSLDGKPVKFATYYVDFRYLDGTGARILEEYKPREGMTYESQLKIRAAEAMGYIINIVS